MLMRISRHQIIFGINYFSIINPGWGRIVWDKLKDHAHDFSACEIAYCSLWRHVKIFRFMWNGMQQGRSMHDGTTMQGNKKQNEQRIHPTQKPVALYDWIYTTTIPLLEKDRVKIIDTHLGSGSSAISAAKYNQMKPTIQFDGCEIDSFFFQAAQKRLTRYQEQGQFDFILK